MPKGDIRDFWDIGLVEVLWKAVTSLLNQYLSTAIMFHDMLHGFQAGSGTGTSTSEAKLIQQLISMSKAVLFEVLLDLQEAYNALDWYRCLEILAEYGVGPRALCIFQPYWGWLAMVTRASRYYGLPFKW